MPEVDIHEVFERFRSGGPLMIPAGPEAARRTSERRRRVRLSVAAAAAVVVTAAAPVVAYDLVPRGGTPDIASSPTTTASDPTVSTPTVSTPTATATVTATPPTPPTPTSDAQPTDGPTAVTLQQSDVPDGFRYSGDDITGDWTLEFAAQICAPPNNLAAAPRASTQWGASFRAGPGPDDPAILQRVDDHTAADVAQTYVDAVRRMAQGCEQTVPYPLIWAIEHQGFAGDDSLVLSWDGDGFFNTYIVVRAGGLVTQIWYRDTDVLDPVLVGQRAAARLCAGTTAC